MRLRRATVSIDMERATRFSRDSAGRREPATSAARPIQCSGGARIQNECPHHFVGIAPQKLLFHASVKNDAILSSLTRSPIQSAGSAIGEVVRVKRMLTVAPRHSAGVINSPPHRQNTVTLAAMESPAVRKAGC